MRLLTPILAVVLAFGAVTHGMAAASPSHRTCSKRQCAKLAKRKEQAVLKGMAWMSRALESQNSLVNLGTDAASIFEGGMTARSATVRNLANSLARYQASRLLPISLKRPIDDRWTLFEALWLLAEADNLRIPNEELLASASKQLAAYPTGNALYDVDVDRLDAAPEGNVFGLLVDSWTLEKALLAFPKLPHPSYGLGDVLRFVLKRHYVGFDEDPDPKKTLFQDHAYLATHVVYVLSDFSRTKVSPRDLGPVYGYLRAQSAAVIRYGDPELIAEFVDVFRILGFDESNDPMICQGTRILLKRQHDDGSWGDTEADDAYDAIHPTWVIVDALRDRIFLDETPYSRFLKSLGPFTPALEAPAR